MIRNAAIATFLALSSSFASAAVTWTVVSHPGTTAGAKSIQMLREEAQKHTVAALDFAEALPSSGKPGQHYLVLAQNSDLPQVFPAALRSTWQKELARVHPTTVPEAFSVIPLHWQGADLLVVSGNDARGQLFGIGWLLRQLAANKGDSLLHAKAFFSAPDKPVRGYQIGYRMKNNTYDAWTLAQFEQQMRDLAVFGMNTVQVIAPVSDDALTSPLYPAPALDTIIGLSRLSQEYGLRFDLYYPELRKDYSQPQDINAELSDFEALVKQLPQVDSLHIPGGDPGRTPPELLFPLLQRESEILHRYHPSATIWVSGQGFDQARYETFYRLLDQKPTWLTGIFFGPQSREGLPQQRQRIPKQFALEFYPDIAHTMHAQFPVPQWDPIFALTEGREPICPRPSGFETIYRHFAPFHTGFMLYSEGVNDDVNKFLWAQWGWSSTISSQQILTQYASYFLHAPNPQVAQQEAAAIAALEKNWDGPLLTNTSIPQTLATLRNMPQPAAPGWRWNSLLYRATYDAYVQLKRQREASAQQDAMTALRQNASSTDLASRALDAMNAHPAQSAELALRQQLLDLADSLFKEAGLQLSVPRYHASNWERGANLDRVDTPLNDKVWLEQQIKQALQGNDEMQRLQSLHAIADPAPLPGTLYDDLGDPAAEPHLQRGKGWHADPEMYQTAIDGIADKTLENGWRLAWLSYAETLYETPLRLKYDHLSTTCAYTLRVVYAGEEYKLPMRLVANDATEIQPFRVRTTNPEVKEYPLPTSLTKNGTLSLEWTRPGGAGGGGRGGQIAEVWLIPCNQAPEAATTTKP